MVELLAPVRDEVSFSAAANAGADAVYFGLGSLNMRANSPGIDLDMLNHIVQRARQKDIKVYVTVNAVIFDDDMHEVDQLLAQCKQAGVDAIICWDLAVIEKAQAMGLAIHISTQASIANVAAAKFYQNLGAQCAVLARELDLTQIHHIKKNTNLKIEVFVHGAMCVSVSGRCFISQHLYGRSANRGDCLQPCRHSYRIIDNETEDQLEIDNSYILSPKDLCALPILDRVLEAGVDVLKIEGRSRAPEYISTVVAVYRQAIDAIEAKQFNQQLCKLLMEKLRSVYNRDFSTGFLLGKPGPQDWSSRYGSQATRRKEHIGKVLNYFTKSQVAHVAFSLPTSIGQTIQIHGPTTGVVELTLANLRNKTKGEISHIQRDDATFPCPPIVRRNDQVYRIIDIDDKRQA